MKSLFILLIAIACGITGAATANTPRDNYIGLRLHKNERIAYNYNPGDGHKIKMRDDNLGIGAYIGNRLTEYVKIEFETLYTGASFDRNGATFDYDVWANMLNMYLYQSFGGAVEPYAGFGLGLSGIWGDVPTNSSDTTADLSWQAMFGVTFALNQRVDLNLGAKYQSYGTVKHKFGETKIDATEIYFGAAYKFGL